MNLLDFVFVAAATKLLLLVTGCNNFKISGEKELLKRNGLVYHRWPRSTQKLFTQCPTEMPIVLNCREEMVWSYCNMSVYSCSVLQEQEVNWYNQIKRALHLCSKVN